MNNKSGSALQKASFVLLLFIAAALAYLIVRERIRAHGQRAESERTVMTAGSSSRFSNPQTFNPSATKSSFAPLRPRGNTNSLQAARNTVGANASGQSSPSIPQRVAEPTSTATPSLTDYSEGAVPAATTSGRSAAQSGVSIVGRATLRGTAPPEVPITLDPMCARLNSTPMTTRHYLVSDGGGLASVFVYIKSGVTPGVTAFGDKIIETRAGTPLLDNVNCQFEPYVFGLRAGQPFQIRNSDSILHNAHSLPKAPGNREFHLGFPVSGITQQKVFDKREVLVQIKCEVHPWMFAYVGVVDHPWFAVTDRDGNFTLPGGLTAGQYTIAAVHQKAGELTQKIIVTESGVRPVTFTFDVPNRLARTNEQ